MVPPVLDPYFPIWKSRFQATWTLHLTKIQSSLQIPTILWQNRNYTTFLWSFTKLMTFHNWKLATTSNVWRLLALVHSSRISCLQCCNHLSQSVMTGRKKTLAARGAKAALCAAVALRAAGSVGTRLVLGDCPPSITIKASNSTAIKNSILVMILATLIWHRPTVSSLASPLSQEGQSERTFQSLPFFLIFPFFPLFSQFFSFFSLNFPLFFDNFFCCRGVGHSVLLLPLATLLPTASHLTMMLI